MSEDIKTEELKFNSLPQKQESKDIILVDGKIAGGSYNELCKLATMLAGTDMVPKGFNSPQKVCAGMLYALELGLPPITSLRKIAVINGTPSLWGDMPLAMVRTSGKLESIKEYFLDKTQKIISVENGNLKEEVDVAICEIQRKSEEKKVYFYTSEDVKKNKNANNPNSDVWKAYCSIMMKRKARSLALKDNFPDVLNGVAIAEYDHEELPDLVKIDDKTSVVAAKKERGVNDKTQELDNLLKGFKGDGE